MENFRRCRICTAEAAIMMSIFGEDALWKKISSFANVQIEEDDSLPQQICMMCTKNTINAALFKEKCEEADAYFRKELFKKTNNFEIVSVSSGVSDEDNDNSYQTSLQSLENKPSIATVSEDPNPPPPAPEIVLQSFWRDSSKAYQCSICSQHFAMKAILKHHLKQNHPDSTENFQCFKCKRNYSAKMFLEKHLRIGNCSKKLKTNSRQIQCGDCNASFLSSQYLGWHKRSGSCPKTASGGSPKNEAENSMTGHLTDYPNENPDKNCQKRLKTGKSRLILNETQTALIKSLMEKNVSTRRLARELNITKTFAKKMRKTFDVNAQSKILEGDTLTVADENGIVPPGDVSGTEPMHNDSSQCEYKPENPLDIGDSPPQNENLEKGPTCSPNKQIQRIKMTKKNKPRKPNVFLDEEKYDKAKALVANNASTTDISRQLDISQMSAWKLRSCILKGIKLRFRNPLSPRTKQDKKPKTKEKRQRLKGEEKKERDKKVTEIILSVLKKDDSIQYWRISEYLREQGYTVSTSAVCKKLKTLGMQRRQAAGNTNESDSTVY